MYWCSAPNNANHCLLQGLSGVSIPAVVCPKKACLFYCPLSRSHHTEPSTHLRSPCTHPAHHSTLREQRVKWVEGRRVPFTSQEVWAGQPISTRCISQHGRLAQVGVTAWFLQPFLHLLQPGLQPVSLQARHRGTWGDSEAVQGEGAVPPQQCTGCTSSFTSP